MCHCVSVCHGISQYNNYIFSAHYENNATLYSMHIELGVRPMVHLVLLAVLARRIQCH